MRRKPNTLVPLELNLLGAAVAFARAGVEEFHGYAIALELAEQAEARRLTAHGTLYRALDRLETAGFLASRLEDADDAAAERRPRRRLYHLTAEGMRVGAAEAAPARASRPVATEPGLASQ
jgi:PadR family transcriptional regulator, regulatory protein PadR